MRILVSVALMSLGLNAAFESVAFAQTPPAVIHDRPVIHHAPVIRHAPPPQWHYVQPAPQPEGWGIGSWFAAPFNAAGTVIGTVAAGVGNVVETPFIAVGQAWSNENCWRNMVDPRDGQTKLYWVCHQ
jgi:hypothetical protein